MPQNVLLGDNPFIGVDHLSQDRARETVNRLDSEKIAQVILTALSNGADGFVFSTHPTNFVVLKLLKELHPEVAFAMHPLLPYAQGYVRLMNEKGTMALFTEFMSRLGTTGKLKAMVSGGLSAMTMNPFKLLATFVNAEVEGFVGAANPQNKLETIYLHEIIVDLAVALKMKDLVLNYVGHIRDSYHLKAGLVTRNFPRLVEFLGEIGQRYAELRVMTPFNKLGFQMNPSREECENALRSHPNLDVVGMSVLAAGLVQLSDAVSYTKSLSNLKSVVVGVSRQEHAKTTFKIFKE